MALLPLLASVPGQGAMVTVESWRPLFQGIDVATGRQQAVAWGERNHAVYALRINLTDPDLRFFALPRCTNCASEVVSTTVSQFLADHQLQAAINCNFFAPNSLASGTPTDVLGLAISQGQVVSPTNDAAHPCALLFTTNNQATFIPRNIPGTNLSGIYTAVSGNMVLLRGGINVANPTNDVDPRAALGLSQDGRFLYAVLIDGRQTGYSDGATYYETADWLLRFGAYEGMNVDGGSCATIALEDCVGVPLRLNSNSYVVTHDGHERGVGHMFGFYARPAVGFVRNVRVDAQATSATVRWETPVPATTQVAYGTTANYGTLSAFSGAPVTRHVMTLAALQPERTYYFRALSRAEDTEHSWACRFTTGSGMVPELIFNLPHFWTYTTNNLDGIRWQDPQYDDSAWLGTGPGLLCVETNGGVAPRNTMLPPGYGGPLPPTYYFRCHFEFEGDPAGVALLLSNYVDDGAVFYLNGAEIYRLRMPASGNISYTDLATAFACSNAPAPCNGDACAVCPDVFRIPAGTNLQAGDNVLAAEVHNYSRGSYDLVFGSALYALRPYTPPVTLHLLHSEDAVTLYWNEAAGYHLQEAAQLGSEESWAETNGPVTNSPCTFTNVTGARFFRLKR